MTIPQHLSLFGRLIPRKRSPNTTWIVLVGLALRRPLARVPENKLKFAVGVLISSFGVFWVGEGLGFHWPGQDLSILGFVGGFLLLSLIFVTALRRRALMNFSD